MPIYYYENDPLAQGLGLENIPLPQPTPAALPVSVVGGLPQESLYSPGTEEFSRLSAYTALLTTVQETQTLTQDLTKWHGGISLAIDVRAGVDFNAFYDRNGLHFFYDHDHLRGKPVYASDSPDIVSHECGHAILDALRSDFWNSPFDEVGAFHESFGDMTAILTTLTWNDVKQAALQPGLQNHNPVADLAEELGTAIYNNYGPDASPPNYLRSAVNQFTYQTPESLPTRGPDSQLTSEVHSFSRVFTAAFYEILVGLAGATNPEALDQARQTVGQLLYAGVQNSGAPRARLYSAIAGAMIDADKQLFGGAHQQLLATTFDRRKISLPPSRGLPAELAKLSLAPKVAIRQGMADVAGHVTSLAGALGFEPGRSFRVQNISSTTRTTHVRLSSVRHVPLVGEDLGVANGVTLDVPEHVTLQFSRETGKSIAGDISRLDQEDLKSLRDSVARLAQRRRIAYRAPSLPRVTLADLASRHQPFYVADDASGVKRLYRAYFDC